MPVGSALIAALLEVVYVVLDFLVWTLIGGAILSWLIAFGIINPYNKLVNAIADIMHRITEPLLKPIRRLLPAMGGVDLSPLILIFIIYFVQSFIRHLAI